MTQPPSCRSVWLLCEPYRASGLARVYLSEARAREDFIIASASDTTVELREVPFFTAPGEQRAAIKQAEEEFND